MIKPLVSFIITAYNEEEYICECIQSCLDQTYPHIEVVVTDDGSTDGTYAAVCTPYGRNHRVRLYRHGTNRGKIHGFNTSYAQAKGEYVAIIGADDINYPERVVVQLDAIERTGVGLVASDLDKVDRDRRLLRQRIVAHRFGLETDCELTFDDLVRHPKAYGSTIFCRRRVADQLFPLDSRLPQESWWLPAMLTYYSGGYFVARSLVAYRIHPGNTTRVFGKGMDHFRYNRTRNEGYYRMLLEFIEDQQLLRQGVVTRRTLEHIRCELGKIEMVTASSLTERVKILASLPRACVRTGLFKALARMAPLRLYYAAAITYDKLRGLMRLDDGTRGA